MLQNNLKSMERKITKKLPKERCTALFIIKNMTENKASAQKYLKLLAFSKSGRLSEISLKQFVITHLLYYERNVIFAQSNL